MELNRLSPKDVEPLVSKASGNYLGSTGFMLVAFIPLRRDINEIAGLERKVLEVTESQGFNFGTGAKYKDFRYFGTVHGGSIRKSAEDAMFDDDMKKITRATVDVIKFLGENIDVVKLNERLRR